MPCFKADTLKSNWFAVVCRPMTAFIFKNKVRCIQGFKIYIYFLLLWSCLNGKLVRFEHRDPMDHISNNSHCVCLDRISLVALISSDHQEELWYCIYSGRVGNSSEKPPPIILLFCLRFMAYTGQTCGTAQSPHKLCEKIVHHLRCNTSLETLNINRTSR